MTFKRREILIDTGGAEAPPGAMRVFVLDDGDPIDLFIDSPTRPSLEGAIIRGRVERVLKTRDAVVVGWGNGAQGVLAASEIRPSPPGGKGAGKALRSGQDVVVQVKADAQGDASGDKLATLTMDISLSGRLLIHLPLGKGVKASRRVELDAKASQSLRDRLGARLAAGGWILRGRGAAPAVELEALVAEGEHLAARFATAKAISGAGVLLPAPDAAARALAEYAVGVYGPAILVDGAAARAAVDAWTAAHGPELAPLVSNAPTGLYASRDLDAALAALRGPLVPLNGGGSLMIETTAALTVVDVNGGEGRDPLSVNLAAADAVGRQLRLRNVGGMVVVDFIRLRRPDDRDRVRDRLNAAVADDPARVDVLGFSRMGLMELIRPRRGLPLAAALDDDGGTG